MAGASRIDRIADPVEYREAIRARVCAVCLDSRDDRSCGLSGRDCAIEAHLPRLVGALMSVHSPRVEDYEAAIRAQVCDSCEEQDASGRCTLRDNAECALEAYLSLVLDAVDDVNEARARAAGARPPSGSVEPGRSPA